MSGVDALVWVMESDAKDGDRIEVHQVWGDLLIDVRQVAGDATVRVGSTPTWRWRLLGVEMGAIPAPVARALPVVLPLLADATCEPRADFEVPSADLPGGRDFVLVRGGRLYVADGWEGFVDCDGRRTPLAELGLPVPGGREIPLQPGSRAVVEIAGQVFQVRRSTAEARAVARFRADPGLVGTFGLVGAFFAAVLAAAPTVSSETTLAELPDPIVQIADLVPQPPKEAKRVESGEKAKDDEGRSGRREADRKQAAGAKRQKTDREIASSAGLLAAGDLATPGLSSELLAGIGGLIGARGNQIGVGGLGSRGPGLGNGGHAEGIGGLGLHGPGTGDRDAGDLGRKADGDIAPNPRDAVLIGNIDRSLIDEVIRRNLSQIRYCYQRELNRDPDLGGKVVVKFTISGDGTVSSAGTKSTTLGNASVESCINARFQRMTFPAPKGGGLAIVSYPFLFQPG
jgi:hypothetical protein